MKTKDEYDSIHEYLSNVCKFAEKYYGGCMYCQLRDDNCQCLVNRAGDIMRKNRYDSQ